MPPHILVVDDEKALAASLAAVLRRNGFSCDWATSGSEAVVKAEDHAPDLVISDIMMPDMDGFGLAACIESRFPHCRIILTTGNLVFEASAKLKYPTLLKPVPVDEVLREVNRAFDCNRSDQDTT
jgi:DNA-binding NtrC family response regulator